MSKRKMLALALMSGSYMMALGLNCLPNIGSTIVNPFAGLLGT